MCLCVWGGGGGGWVVVCWGEEGGGEEGGGVEWGHSVRDKLKFYSRERKT